MLAVIAVLAVPGLLGLTGCSSGDSLPSYLGKQYQPQGGSGSDREFRAGLPVAAVDATVTDRFQPLESIRANSGTFLRYDDNQYLSILPAAAGSTILFGPAPSRAYTAFQDAGGAAAAVDERGGGPGEGK